MLTAMTTFPTALLLSSIRSISPSPALPLSGSGGCVFRQLINSFNQFSLQAKPEAGHTVVAVGR